VQQVLELIAQQGERLSRLVGRDAEVDGRRRPVARRKSSVVETEYARPAFLA
jgi:hypothetical protein